ncbi:expressed unknown protein [Seminavis robusta]|uniref:Uncharacterized protein n=1 Tax=Seminavis robusta TaxID=568900 RepID=A0A9N8E1C4_9STRA|nr:expressed unknown protein [Seminavis robusta]|eukprot:Sro550_g164670.1 n/a (500) ;mRNA; f:24762-26347
MAPRSLVFLFGFLLLSCIICALGSGFFLERDNALRRMSAVGGASASGASITGIKILYIVTSIAEYDSGKRKTIEGRDRFVETLIPVVSESVQSMLAAGYQVDTYLIAHYSLRQDRYDLLRESLPDTVGLDLWDDACPVGYPKASEGSMDYIINVTRALARQHRYVIKDKLPHYDVFVNFEDDMLIRGDHVQQYLQVSAEIDRLWHSAPTRLDPATTRTATTVEAALDSFHGPMSKIQFARMIPGFIRVERAANATGFQKRTRPGRIPVEESYRDRNTGQYNPVRVDPKPCCHRPGESLAASSDLFLWESHIKALGIRHIPESNLLDWVLLQRGGSPAKMEVEELIGDYWSGRDGDFVLGLPTDARPDPMESIYSNNQGGWMATRKQIWNWHTRQCWGGFLPPFSSTFIYPMDGMNHVVEYWSGGGNLYGRLACNLQRIIPLDPPQFSRHLLYHTSNNKQKQLKFVKGLFSRVDTLLGQLHTVRKRAEKVMEQENIARPG